MVRDCRELLFTAPNGSSWLSRATRLARDRAGAHPSTTLSQPFSEGGTLYTVKATFNFVSNEYHWVNQFAGNGPLPYNTSEQGRRQNDSV